jgi:hypothetical protein
MELILEKSQKKAFIITFLHKVHTGADVVTKLKGKT